MGRHAGYADGDWRLRADRFPALPADYRDFSADQTALARRDGDDRVDHLHRANSFQRASGI
jgi:hypothetical protein